MAKGIRVSEETVNLLTANQSSVETNTTGFSANNVGTTLTRVTTEKWSGNASLNVVCDATADFQGVGITSARPAVKASTAYTASVYLKGTGNVYVYSALYNAGGTMIAGTNIEGSVVALTGEWQRIVRSRTGHADAATMTVIIYTRDPTGRAADFYLDGLQIEEKTFATPWQLGGSPRTPDRYTRTQDPCPDVFARGVSMVMPHASTVAMTRTAWRQGGFRPYIDSADNKAKFTDGVVTAETSALTWAEGDKVHLYGGRKDGKLFVAAKVGAAAHVSGESAATPLIESGGLLYLGNRQIGLYFDGVDDRVNCGNSALFNFTNSAFTVEFCLNVSLLGTDMVIVERGVISGNGWVVYKDTTNRIRLVTNQSGARQDSYGQPIIANQLYQFAVVRDGAACLIYRNGIADINLAGVHSNPDSRTGNLLFGCLGGASAFTKGNIFDVRIWNIARTQADIQRDMHKRLVGNETSLVGYWPLDEATGTTAYDLTANANNGTITGASHAAIECANTTLYNFVRHEGSAVNIENYMANVT